MKAKLVKYPFDKKKYRWDYKEMGKLFEYTWERSGEKNYDTVEPYIEVEPFEYDDTKTYYYTDIVNPNALLYDDLTYSSSTDNYYMDISTDSDYIEDSYCYYTYNTMLPLQQATFSISKKESSVNYPLMRGTYTYNTYIKQVIPFRIEKGPYILVPSNPALSPYPKEEEYLIPNCHTIELTDWRIIGEESPLGYYYFVNNSNYTYDLNDFNDVSLLTEQVVRSIWGSGYENNVNVINYDDDFNTTKRSSGQWIPYPSPSDLRYDSSKIDSSGGRGYINAIIRKVVLDTDENNFCLPNIITVKNKLCLNEYGEEYGTSNTFMPDDFDYTCNNIQFTYDNFIYGHHNYVISSLNNYNTNPRYEGKLWNITSFNISEHLLGYYRIFETHNNIIYSVEDSELVNYITENNINDINTVSNILINKYNANLTSNYYSRNDKIIDFRIENNTIIIYDTNNTEYYDLSRFQLWGQSNDDRFNGVNEDPQFIRHAWGINLWNNRANYHFSLRVTAYPSYHQYATYKQNKIAFSKTSRTFLNSVPYVLLKEDWSGLIEGVNCFKVNTFNSVNYILKKNVKLIGDIQLDYVEIPNDNQYILSFHPSDYIDGELVRKQLLFNPITSYKTVNNSLVPDKRTFLSFNEYTTAEWGGYHFYGDEWNSIGSPFGYATNITTNTGGISLIYDYEVCAPGKYLNILSLNDGLNITVFDTDDNTYISSTDTVDDYKYYWNEGGVPYFDDDYVKSYDRHAYPDYFSHHNFVFRIRKDLTKFIEYYRTDNLVNVELFNDRYKYTHETVDLCDRSWEGTVCGTPTSTGENTIPDATWREYLGLYLGESIPLLHIEEAVVPPSEILGVPQYDKQVNTSDTLKYGTVASASLSFTLNKPVNECLTLNNQLLVLYYDFKNTDEWERLGFFRIDNIEALDEYSTSLLAHDETYKLNKYVDDFLEAYTQSTTLDLFYRDLLDYCDCFYDTQQPIIHNGNINMSNVYHAVKTTGIQVAHYIAILVPGFIHTNIDGDIVLSQYQIANNNITTSDYTNLVYCAYNTDMINKVKITSNNAVKGESAGSGENVYFLADNPLLSELQITSYFNDLADGILAYYSTIPAYRPATIDFLILPRSLAIGDIVNLTTPKNENYAVVIMRMSITSSGVQVQSFGTQKYPVEAESNSEFVNLINDMGEISGDVSNMMEAQRTMANAIAENAEHISQNTTDISTIITKNTQQDTTLTNHTNAINTLQGYKSTTSNNLATIILSNTLNNVALKGYVDTNDTTTLNSAKAYADSLVGTSMSMKFGTISWSMSSSGTIKSVHCIFIGSNDKRNGIFIPTAYVADDNNKTYMFRVYNNSYYVLYDDGSTTTRVGWFQAYNASFTED